jgi:predicted extracellular nuclease
MRFPFIFLAAAFGACGGGGGESNANPPPPAGTGITPIHDIQGGGASSPLDGQAVTVEGIVTGDFQDNDADTSRNLGGFYIQNTPDADPASSDAVFVFDGGNPSIDVTSGDLVRVGGTANEHFGETQIAANSVAVIGNGSIAATSVNLPAAATIPNSDGRLVADLERFEGMLIRLPQTMTVAELWELEPYGAVLLSEGGRQHPYTSQNPPDVAGFDAHNEAVASRRLILDDGQRVAYANPVRYLNAGAAPDYSIRIGDQISGVTGTLRYSRGSGGNGLEGYRLMPTEEPQFESMNPRPNAPNISGAMRIASYNVLNFFSTVDGSGDICGPSASSSCRGADSVAEFDRQLAKTVTGIRMIDADVVGLVELENNSSESLQHIVDGLNAALGNGSYAFVNTGTIGDDTIKTGFVFKPAAVTPVGAFAVLDSSVDNRFSDQRNRPVLAQTFAQNSNGARITVAVNHLKSKGSDCDSAGDPDVGDGQGNCNVTRSNAAAALADWLASDPTGSGDTDILIIGDPNTYFLEDPLTALKSAGYTNLGETMLGLDTYSFVFDGQSGSLDHALASPSLAPQVTAISEWHINADEPPLLDYNLENSRDPALFDPAMPYRASDHDPLIIGLNLLP